MSAAHPSPEQDLAIARAALARGDLSHAARHLAGALAADPLHPEFLETAEALLREAPENAAQLIPLKEGGWFGDVALRAWLLARTGNATEALSLLLHVAAVKPEVPYLAWTRRWFESPGFARAVEPLPVAAAAEQILRGVDLSAHPAMTDSAIALLARVRAVHPEVPELLLVHARMLRGANRFQEGLESALAYERAYSNWTAAIAVAGAYRCLGDVPSALEYFRLALTRKPEDLAVRLDIGDLLWAEGKSQEALASYEEVLAREPEHAWALPSALLLRAQVTGNAALLRDFLRFAEQHPENPRAQDLRQEVLAAGYTPPPEGEPWVDYLPEPSEATLSAVLKVLDAFAEGKVGANEEMKLTVSCLEAPSAMLSARRQLATRVSGELRVTVQNIPKPDPRVPRQQGWLQRLGFRPQRPALWRYEGTEAHPAVEPPSARVSERIGALAAKPFHLGRWRAEAATLSRELSEVRPLEIAAVMVHPPPGPSDTMAWNWLNAVQVAAALVLAESEAGRALLHDIVLGPTDWVAGAAVVALTAYAGEDREKAGPVLGMIVKLLGERPSQGHWCLEYPLVVSALRMSGSEPESRDWLQEWRRRLES
ncbi:hypothetical protein ACN28E_49860 [Archangium lansingense]|uniref:hypothetical protein n=1 Tax=Archangium lansingense TaxID=2995310 RepID=UPI003B7CBF6D